MESLVSKIQNDFINHSVLEVFVLDESGSPMEIFAGPSAELTPELLDAALAMPGCFYVFSIVGVDEALVDSNKLTRAAMVRKEFCWMTQPTPPRVLEREGKVTHSTNSAHTAPLAVPLPPFLPPSFCIRPHVHVNCCTPRTCCACCSASVAVPHPHHHLSCACACA
jgi:hypothetical protein